MLNLELIRFEINKFLFNKRSLITIAAVLAISILSGILDGYYWHKQVGDINSYNNMAKQYEGKVDLDFQHISDTKNETSAISLEEKQALTLDKYYSMAVDSAKMWNNKKDNNPKEKYTIDYLEKFSSNLAEDDKKNDFAYLDTIKNLNMLKTNTEPEFHNIEGWQRIYSYVLSRKGALLIEIVLLVLISPIFSDENANNMMTVIKSTKKGHKHIMWAKIITSLSFSIVWVTTFYVINVSLRIMLYKNSFFPTESLNNIRGYEFTPFNLSIFQGLIISYLITIVSVCSITIIFCLISSTQKNNIASICISSIFIILAFFTEGNSIFNKLISLLPGATIDSSSLLSQYVSYNILNTPVTYPVIALVSLVFIMILGVILTSRVFNGKLYRLQKH